MKIHFTEEECLNIINLSNQLPVIKSDGGYKDLNTVNYIGWRIPYHEDNKWIFDRMINIFKADNTRFNITKYPPHIGLHKYNVGDKFEKHNDFNKNRMWGIGTNLNEEYKGGDFYLYEPTYLLPKKRGEIYYFESMRDHEVLEILEGERWSLIMFLCYEHLTFKSTLI
jgi:hypothetical protein